MPEYKPSVPPTPAPRNHDPAAPRRWPPPRRGRTPDRGPCRGLALADGLADGQGPDVRGAQRVAGDAPVAALPLLDDNPGDRAHVLAFDLHHGVGQPTHHVLLLLGGEDPLDDLDVDERHILAP